MASVWVSEAQVIKLPERVVESEKLKQKEKCQQHEKWRYTVSLDNAGTVCWSIGKRTIVPKKTKKKTGSVFKCLF